MSDRAHVREVDRVLNGEETGGVCRSEHEVSRGLNAQQPPRVLEAN